jgi:hypothetical protein
MTPSEREKRRRELRARMENVNRRIREDEVYEYAGGSDPGKLKVAVNALLARGVASTDCSAAGNMLRGLLGQLGPDYRLTRGKGSALERATAVPYRGSGK